MNFKRTMFLAAIVVLSFSVYASHQGNLVDALRFIIEKGKTGGISSMIHAYQYTCTTSVNNPDVIVFDSTHDMQGEFLEKAGLDSKHRERFSGLFADRSGERVMALWSQYRDKLLPLVDSDLVKEFFSQYYYTPASLLYAYQHPSFKDIMKNVMILTDAAGEDNIDEILSTELENYKVNASISAIRFWYRRYREGNHQQVYQVLKELDRHYGITCYKEKEMIGNSLGDFRRARWGMSMKEVVECENIKRYAYSDNRLYYNVPFQGEEVKLEYHFDNDKLFSATYEFQKNTRISNDDLDDLLYFHFGGKKLQKEYEVPTIFKRGNTKVTNGHLIMQVNDEEWEAPYLQYDDARVADQIREKYSPFNLWKEDSRTILSLISGLRKYRTFFSDTTVQKDYKSKMLKKDLVKLNREVKGKKIHINRAEILYVAEQTVLTPYGKKRYRQLMAKIKKESPVNLDDDSYLAKWAHAGVYMKLANDKRCFRKTGKYNVEFIIPYPDDSVEYTGTTGISSNPDAGDNEDVQLINVTIARVVESQEEALTYNKGYLYSIDGKIKSIYYDNSVVESVKIEIE